MLLASHSGTGGGCEHACVCTRRAHTHTPQAYPCCSPCCQAGFGHMTIRQHLLQLRITASSKRTAAGREGEEGGGGMEMRERNKERKKNRGSHGALHGSALLAAQSSSLLIRRLKVTPGSRFSSSGHFGDRPTTRQITAQSGSAPAPTFPSPPDRFQHKKHLRFVLNPK